MIKGHLAESHMTTLLRRLYAIQSNYIINFPLKGNIREHDFISLLYSEGYWLSWVPHVAIHMTLNEVFLQGRGIFAPFCISDPEASRNHLTYHMDREAKALLSL